MAGESMESAMDDPRELGTRLRTARETVGLTQVDVAGYLGLPRTAVVAIEAGTRRVKAEELDRLASLYRRSVEWLLGRDAVPSAAVTNLHRLAAGLTAEDQAQLEQYAQFLADRRQASAAGGHSDVRR
jgi:transcriptional regulator with XRE-family HTH domain